MDTLNRFTNKDNPLARASAALSLADIARTHLPGKPPEIITPDSYLYFLDAASRLVRALHMEEDTAVRDAILEALGLMVAFAQERGNGYKSERRQDGGGNETELLIPLINRLTNANRVARDNFVRAYAEYGVVITSPHEGTDIRLHTTRARRELRHLLPEVAPFCWQVETTCICLHDLRKQKLRRSHAAIYAAIRQGQSAEDKAKSDAQSLAQVRRTAAQLMNTRDALAHALRALTTPSHFPQLFRANSDIPEAQAQVWQEYMESLSQWQRLPELNLNNCFLAGARFGRAQLQGAEFVWAQLHGADFQGTALQDANFVRTHLQKVNLGMARLEYADFGNAKLQKANLGAAKLQEASFFKAQLQGTNLRDARLQGAKLYEAQLQGATWWLAHSSSWEGEEGQALYQWLHTNFPRPGGLAEYLLKDEDFAVVAEKKKPADTSSISDAN